MAEAWEWLAEMHPRMMGATGGDVEPLYNQYSHMSLSHGHCPKLTKPVLATFKGKMFRIILSAVCVEGHRKNHCNDEL